MKAVCVHSFQRHNVKKISVKDDISKTILQTKYETNKKSLDLCMKNFDQLILP